MTTTAREDFETEPGQSTPAVRTLALPQATPLHVSAYPMHVDTEALHVGLDLLGLPSTPQGEVIASVVQATRDDGRPLYRRVGVQVPRRSAKSTSLTAVALGRMASMDGYRIISTAQTGKVAKAMWLDTVMALDAHYVGLDADSLPYTARLSNGSECLTWKATGATWRPVPPTPLSYRSQAADLLVFEEAGHIRPEVAADLKAGALPTQDTRPNAQAWMVGTPGPVRQGLLWDALEMGRGGRAGIVEYAACEADDVDDEATWWRVHPGLSSGMTTIEVIRERHEEMDRDLFAAEYLGVWPQVASALKAVDPQAWAKARVAGLGLPAKFALGADAVPDGSAAAIAAAWRVDGVPHVALLERRAGTGWMTKTIRDMVAKHRGTAVAMDMIGANVATIEELGRGRPPIIAKQPGFKALQGACQTFVATTPVHQAQPDLDAAVEAAVWREVEGGRLIGRKSSKADVSPLVAAILALWAFDGAPAVRPKVTITSR